MSLLRLQTHNRQSTIGNRKDSEIEGAWLPIDH